MMRNLLTFCMFLAPNKMKVGIKTGMLFLFLAFAGSSIVFAQDDSFSPRFLEVGIEVQAYPTGVIPGIRADFAITPRDIINVRGAYQIINHRSLGVHDDEKGNGVGGTLGYRRFILKDLEGLFAGARFDVWANSIDWVDNPVDVLTAGCAGTTDILVMQPTLEVGYTWLASEHFSLSPSFSFGYEINVSEKLKSGTYCQGKEGTGEGAIILLGLAASYRF